MKSLAEIYSNVGLTMFLEAEDQARDSAGRFSSSPSSGGSSPEKLNSRLQGVEQNIRYAKSQISMLKKRSGNPMVQKQLDDATRELDSLLREKSDLKAQLRKSRS